MNELLPMSRRDAPDLATSRTRAVRRSGVGRRALAVLVGCIGLLAVLVPVAAAANHSFPATYKGTVATGGTVEFDTSADGASVTRFVLEKVPFTACGTTIVFSRHTAIAPITNETFSWEVPGSPTSISFKGSFPANQQAQGTISIHNGFPLESCSADVNWTATTSTPPPETMPSNTGSPVASGTPSVGQTLSCANGSWTGIPTPTYAYRWLRDGSAIAGASGSTYVVQSADQGHGLACEVTATNSAGHATATSNTLTVPPPPTPTVANAAQSNSTWREGNKLAIFSRKKKPPIGTTFSFILNEQANVSFAFTQQVGGRKVKGKCVAQTKNNLHKPSCKRTVTRGTLSFTGHSGVNKVVFQGRVSRSKKLGLGRYTLAITATTATGRRSQPKSLSFTIVK